MAEAPCTTATKAELHAEFTFQIRGKINGRVTKKGGVGYVVQALYLGPIDKALWNFGNFGVWWNVSFVLNIVVFHSSVFNETAPKIRFSRGKIENATKKKHPKINPSSVHRRTGEIHQIRDPRGDVVLTTAEINPFKTGRSIGAGCVCNLLAPQKKRGKSLHINEQIHILKLSMEVQLKTTKSKLNLSFHVLIFQIWNAIIPFQKNMGPV